MATDMLRHALVFAGTNEDSSPDARSRRRHAPVSTHAVDLDALAAGVRAGDREAFDTLFVALQGELWHFARSIVRDGDVAHDVVQDVFVDVWNRHAQWSVHESIRGYFFGAVRNRALHTTRSATARERTATRLAASLDIERSNAVLADEGVREAELIAVMRRAVDALPERQRSAMLLRWNTELNAADIGRALGVSDTAARKLLAKGEATLRQVYDRLTRG